MHPRGGSQIISKRIKRDHWAPRDPGCLALRDNHRESRMNQESAVVPQPSTGPQATLMMVGSQSKVLTGPLAVLTTAGSQSQVLTDPLAVLTMAGSKPTVLSDPLAVLTTAGSQSKVLTAPLAVLTTAGSKPKVLMDPLAVLTTAGSKLVTFTEIPSEFPWMNSRVIEEGAATLAPEQDGAFGWLNSIPPQSSSDAALSRARARNLERLRDANEKDNQILSKYLPADIKSFFPCGIEGPVDFRKPSESWVQEVLTVARTPCPVPSKPHVRLGIDMDSLIHNTSYLATCDWDMGEVLERHKGTTGYHGSEFRPIQQLSRIVGRHPNFKFLRKMLEEGFDYILSRELSEEERTLELEAQLKRGNHQSATGNSEEIQGLLGEDVRHGFVLPFLSNAVRSVRGVQVQPGGMVCQLSLKADGSRRPKNRFTHDLSFSITAEDASINSRIIIGAYPDMVYGWCLFRILHRLAAMRSRNPGVKIFLSKFDFSDAYKRISQSPRASASTVIKFGEIAYLCWRMVFGGSPNPAGFSCFSETLTDLANEIGMSSYSPERGSSPTVQESHLQVREVELETDPILPAFLPAFEVDTRADCFCDCFIDDIINCHLDTVENRKKAGHLVQLAVHVMGRPHAGDSVEPVPRRPLLGPEKLEAEGRSCERQVILGWEVRTRSFIVRLPDDKHRAWKDDLNRVTMQKSARTKELEALIGRLNHAAQIIPLSRHFLNEIRNKCLSTNRRNHNQSIRFSDEELRDLKLWDKFLDLANKGLSINVLVVRTPTRLAWSDSCPYGLGGYTLTGFAWRVRVPLDCPFYGDDTVNNVLEFLGMAVSILLLLEEAARENEKHPCLLVLGDNTSAISWIFKSGRVRRDSYYYSAVKFIARHITVKTLEREAQVCSQHIAGTSNSVADILSFEGRVRGGKTDPLTEDCPPNDVLTNRFHSYHSQVIPHGFKIHQLPDEIESFVSSTMRIVARSWTQKGKRQTKDGIGTGGGGEHSCKSGEWEATSSLMRYPTSQRSCSWREDLSSIIERSTSTQRGELLRNVRSRWYQQLYETPLAMWHRRSGNVEGPAPSTSRTESMTQDRCTRESRP